MGKAKPHKAYVEDLTNFQTRRYLRGLCPCRANSSEDLEGWRTLFNKARYGSFSERKSAAHSIGTLIERAKDDEMYRSLLVELEDDLDSLMRDPRAASQVLGVMKGHGHQRKGAGRRNYRKAISILALKSPNAIASWLNKHPKLLFKMPIDQHSKLVKKLAKWLDHRVKFEPNRQTSEADLLRQVQLFQPSAIRR